MTCAPLMHDLEPRLLPLVDAAYEVVEKRLSPEDFLAALCLAVEAGHVALWELDTTTQETRLLAASSLPLPLGAELGRSLRHELSNAPLAEARVIPPTTLKSDSPRGLSLVAKLLQTGSTLLLLRACRKAGATFFSDRETSTLQALAPHVARMLRLTAMASRLNAENVAALGLLDVVPWGVVVFTGQLRLLFQNRVARRILSQEDGLFLGDNRLRAWRRADSRQLDKLFEAALAGASAQPIEVVGSLSIARASSRRDLAVVCARLSHDPTAFHGDCPAIALLVADPEDEPAVSQVSLRDLFGMTRTEARVSSLLARGRTLAEIASELGVTQNTCRAHVSRALSKSGARRQGELIKLLLTSPICLPPIGGEG